MWVGPRWGPQDRPAPSGLGGGPVLLPHLSAWEASCPFPPPRTCERGSEFVRLDSWRTCFGPFRFVTSQRFASLRQARGTIITVAPPCQTYATSSLQPSTCQPGAIGVIKMRIYEVFRTGQIAHELSWIRILVSHLPLSRISHPAHVAI